jgi:hypothetical protein
VARWSYLLADLRTNAITAEIPLTGVRISTKLGAAGTMSGTWNIAQSWDGGDPYGLTRPARTAIYALRDGRPIFGGLVWTSDCDDGGSVSLGAADFWSYFDHRRVVPLLSSGSPPVTEVANLDVSFVQVDQNEIARQLVAIAQSHNGGDIGIVPDTANSGVLRDRTWHGYELADVGQALKQLSEVEGGPDIQFTVGANLDDLGRPIRLMRIGTPNLGQVGSPFVFESGAAILSYRFPSDGTRMATRAYALGEGSERGAIIAVAEDADTIANGWPLLESDANYSTVTEAATLQAHAVADRYAGRLPVVLPTITVAGDGSNRFGQRVWASTGEYQVGDQARVVIKDRFFSGDGLDAVFRLVEIAMSPGDDGVETNTLTLSPVSDDVA